MRIAITQRVEWVPGYNERRDCLDQQWARMLESLGFDIVAVPNALQDPQAWLARQQVAGLILTGGNDLAHLPDATQPAPERDNTESALLAWAEKVRLPVLAVCRGMQMLNFFLGGNLVPVTGHVACRHEVQALSDDARFCTYREVNSFHGRGMMFADLAPYLQPRLCASDQSIEAFTHSYLPWIGIMWHPERETPASSIDAQLISQLFESRNN